MPIDLSRLEKPVRKIRKLLKKMSSDPKPDQVHDLRTNSRRLEAALRAMSLDSRGNGRKVLKSVSKLRKRAGRVRDMDVLTSYASGLGLNDGEQECSVQLLEHLGAERRKAARKLYQSQKKFSDSLRPRLKRAFAQFEKAIAQAEDGDPKGATAPTDVTASVLHLVSQLSRPAHLGRTNLHPYRLKVKELHNLLRMAENSKDEEFVNTLGQVKDAIGEWHDWEELLGIAKELLSHPNCDLLHELKQRANDRYNSALASTESMRKRFLRLSSSTERRSSRPTERVWSATAALAA